TTSCGKEIRDFFKAIDHYGYKAKDPLSKKTVTVDKQLLGGYVYNSLPVIISAKDDFTYQLTFLAVELDLEDVKVDAHMSVIKNDRYLNINMGENYSFLKISSFFNNQLEVSLLRNSIEPYVKPENLKSWLEKHGREQSFAPDSVSSVDIFYGFAFNKITVEKAYQIQREQIHEKMVDLFNGCKEYYCYDELEKRYPNEPLLAEVRENIFNKCKTIENYQVFINRFPGDALSEKAKSRIAEIKMFKADSVNFTFAVKQNTIDAYENFINNSSTSVFRDSAGAFVTALANRITENDIEWRWTGSSRTDALKLIYQKIDYSDQPLSQEWYQQHLTFYCLKLMQPDVTEKGLTYLDKLAAKNPSTNEMLNLYLSKGFLLWSLEKIDLSLEVFKSKINETYTGDNGISVRTRLKLWYKDLKGSDIIFPKEKATWKKIRKL
ncbi:MAG: hypothetical protein WCL06_13220, partial [Bacteroidota bacterium]